MTNLCQTGIRYQEVIIWNQILNAKLKIDCSEEYFKKMLKKSIQIELINNEVISCFMLDSPWVLKHNTCNYYIIEL